MKLENRIFNGRQIRMVWSESGGGKWYFSVVDVIEALTDSLDASTYWRVLKNRLKKEGRETVTICNAFKLPAKDGKLRLSPVVDYLQLLSIMEFISSPKVEDFKLWIHAYSSSDSPQINLANIQQYVYNKIALVSGEKISDIV